MSRTHKDAPYKIRERRLGIKDRSENCAVCAEGPVRTVRTGFSAIFFAHEVAEREAFMAIAEEGGFTLKIDEVHGYLTTGTDPELNYDPYGGKRSIFEGYLDPDRAIYGSPSGLRSDLRWNRAGRAAPVAKEISSPKDEGSTDDLWRFLDSRPAVSHKKNIFVVVSISKESSRVARHYHGGGHDRDSMSYLLSGHCHCISCEPKEQGTRTELRATSGRLKKAFNGGDEEAVEEISEELVRSNGGAYRDTMPY